MDETPLASHAEPDDDICKRVEADTKVLSHVVDKPAIDAVAAVKNEPIAPWGTCQWEARNYPARHIGRPAAYHDTRLKGSRGEST